jgi:molybdate transport system substrate-binding protein
MKDKLAVAFLFLTLLSLGCKKNKADKISVATAANMQFAMKELSLAFTKQSGIKSDIIVSSSGKLTAQIKEGAPYDLLVSADMKYPEDLYKSGFTTKKPEIYAYGKLVLWSITEGINPSIEILEKPEIRHIAIANPKTAPYGRAAIDVLKHFGIFEKVKKKLVYGESISQTNQFIISGSAQIGFTAKSVVLSPKIAKKGKWSPIDESSYTPIAQGVVILKKDNPSKNTEKFYSFLFSDRSKEILENYGYLLSDK